MILTSPVVGGDGVCCDHNIRCDNIRFEQLHPFKMTCSNRSKSAGNIGHIELILILMWLH